MAMAQPQPPEWDSQWGLAFETGAGDAAELERGFLQSRASSHQATAAVLSAGVALVHGLLAFKLHSQGQDGLAIAAAATMAQQLLVWLLAVLAPAMFDRLRPVLYTLSATIPTLQSSPLFSRGLSAAGCSTPGGVALWASQLLSSGVPWLLVHAVLFPLTVNQGLVVHGVATVLLLASNRQRCTTALQQCPAAGPLLVRVASALQRLTVFSAATDDWVGEGGLPNSAGPLTGSVPPGAVAPQLRACMGVFGALQIALGYLAVLQLAWWLERAARLAYLRQTEAVEAEWKLERKRRPLGTLGPELAGLLLVCWQAMDLWLGATAAQSPI